MKSNQLGHFFLMSCLLFLAGCSTMPSYQEPNSNTPGLAVIKVSNEGYWTSALNTLIKKPDYQLNITAIDGQRTRLFSSDEINLNAGHHQVEVSCTINNSPVGTKIFNIQAQPGRTYTVVYPMDMNAQGYYTNLDICNSLVLK